MRTKHRRHAGGRARVSKHAWTCKRLPVGRKRYRPFGISRRIRIVGSGRTWLTQDTIVQEERKPAWRRRRRVRLYA